MKTFITILFTIISLQFTFAQATYTEAQRKKDKAKLDSICKKSPSNCLYYSGVIGANSIFKRLVPRRIVRTSKICFDKKFEYFTVINGKSSSGCYYMNTRDGYVAYFLDNNNNSCDGLQNPQPGFDMIISSKIGESFIFRISNRGVKTFMAEMPIEGVNYGGQTNFVLKNPAHLMSDQREPFTNDNLPTLGYVLEGIQESSVKFLFSPYHALRIPLKDYVGAFGTGYYADSHGNTLTCLSVQSPGSAISITKITDVSECFDMSGYSDGTAQSIEENEQSINNRKKGLENEAENAEGNFCNAAKTLNMHKTQVLNAELAYNKYVKSGGNPMSKEGIKLASKAQDVRNEVIKHRLETELKICETERDIQTAPSRNSTASQVATYQKKLACYNDAVKDLTNLETALKDIDAREGNYYAKALPQKNVLYFQKMKNINLDCNFKKGKLQENPMNKGANEIGDKLKEMIKRK